MMRTDEGRRDAGGPGVCVAGGGRRDAGAPGGRAGGGSAGTHARREALRWDSAPPEHAGLLLQRGLARHGDEHAAAREMLKHLEDVVAPAPYHRAWQRWRDRVVGAEACLAHVVGKTTGPLAIGLGNESPLEVGLTLHHTYGMPVLPGSALKGLCVRAARAARDAVELTPEQEAVLFGTTQSAAYLTFWDGWYDPTSVEGKPFRRDVVTVHHPRYYLQAGGQPQAPSDFDDPNPIPFLSVRPGAKFLCAVEGPDAAWAEFGRRLLEWGLEQLGIGAKTNAGYGRLRRFAPLPRPPRRELWVDCRIHRQKQGNVVTGRITGERGEFTLRQTDLQRFEAELRSRGQEHLDRFRERTEIQASMTVLRDGDRLSYVSVEMVHAAQE